MSFFRVGSYCFVTLSVCLGLARFLPFVLLTLFDFNVARISCSTCNVFYST